MLEADLPAVCFGRMATIEELLSWQYDLPAQEGPA